MPPSDFRSGRSGDPRILASFLIVGLQTGVLAELHQGIQPAVGGSRPRRFRPDDCLAIPPERGVPVSSGQKGVVKLNIDPIVRSETGLGPNKQKCSGVKTTTEVKE